MSAIGIIKTGSFFLLFLYSRAPSAVLLLIGVNGKKELETWRCRALLGLATASLACTCKLFKKKQKKIDDDDDRPPFLPRFFSFFLSFFC
jgi:hypothetical protein